MRDHRRTTAAIALALALVTGGCTAGEDATGAGAVGADSIVRMKPTAGDLQALDLREKLIALEGVDGVVYSQPDKTLRIDFADTASDDQRKAALDVARADDQVKDITEG